MGAAAVLVPIIVAGLLSRVRTVRNHLKYSCYSDIALLLALRGRAEPAGGGSVFLWHWPCWIQDSLLIASIVAVLVNTVGARTEPYRDDSLCEKHSCAHL